MQRKNTDTTLTEETQLTGRKRSLANLRPFKKGQSGNPAGRPKSALLSDALRRQLAETHPGETEKTRAEMIAKALIDAAINGDVSAIKEVGDRTEGKAKQAVDVDLNVMDWQQMAQSYGIDEREILKEAKLLLAESADDSGDE